MPEENTIQEVKKEPTELEKAIFPETCKEALDRFEKGTPLVVCKLNGTGPTYDQTTWIGILRLIKKYHDKDVSDWPNPSKESWNKDTADRVHWPILNDLKLTEEQYNIIRSTAYNLLIDGWRTPMLQVHKDDWRIITNFWPRLEIPEK